MNSSPILSTIGRQQTYQMPGGGSSHQHDIHLQFGQGFTAFCSSLAFSLRWVASLSLATHGLHIGYHASVIACGLGLGIMRGFDDRFSSLSDSCSQSSRQFFFLPRSPIRSRTESFVYHGLRLYIGRVLVATGIMHAILFSYELIRGNPLVIALVIWAIASVLILWTIPRQHTYAACGVYLWAADGILAGQESIL